ncbi:hypothetical protein CAEBREN_17674 [Caenorhabditis brenneri]|uniref:BTB domain-containing protein n=1 Tax=Caenorhabditis brenneri TaxID=135651 RepID=G0MVW2_CAEBE|nr:hypothetical protein CAEBREN_17674 [Caenorhabditis brenneri]
MTETPEISIYEKTFAKSDKTDAILVVDGKKLHVNKAVLSYHSDYFQALFNSDFKEKSMEEIEINDVKFEDFATLLSQIQNNPITPEVKNITILLELADRFLLPAAKRHLELFVISPGLSTIEKIELADKFELGSLLKHTLKSYKHFQPTQEFSNFSDNTKARIFDRQIELHREIENRQFAFPPYGYHRRAFRQGGDEEIDEDEVW